MLSLAFESIVQLFLLGGGELGAESPKWGEGRGIRIYTHALDIHLIFIVEIILASEMVSQKYR